jgi:hypothetical protein
VRRVEQTESAVGERTCGMFPQVQALPVQLGRPPEPMSPRQFASRRVSSEPEFVKHTVAVSQPARRAVGEEPVDDVHRTKARPPPPGTDPNQPHWAGVAVGPPPDPNSANVVAGKFMLAVLGDEPEKAGAMTCASAKTQVTDIAQSLSDRNAHLSTGTTTGSDPIMVDLIRVQQPNRRCHLELKRSLGPMVLRGDPPCVWKIVTFVIHAQ